MTRARATLVSVADPSLDHSFPRARAMSKSVTPIEWGNDQKVPEQS